MYFRRIVNGISEDSEMLVREVYLVKKKLSVVSFFRVDIVFSSFGNSLF